VGSLAVSEGSRAGLLAVNVSRKHPLFASPRAIVCRPLQLLIILLCTVLLASCASTQAKYDAAVVDYRIQQSLRGVTDGGSPTSVTTPMPLPSKPKVLLDEHGRPWREGTGDASSLRIATPPPSTGPSGWDVLGAIVAIPLLIPIAMITNYPGPGVHCRSWTYKDQYHVKCY
jgi:hypothetical protein